MSIFPKKHFRWVESKSFAKDRRRQEIAALLWWHRPVAILVIIANFVLFWGIAHLNPANTPPPWYYALPPMPIAAVLFVYGIPWFISLFPSEVRFFDKELILSQGNRQNRSKYTDIQSFSWKRVDGWLVLHLDLKKRVLQLHVPDEISAEDLAVFLAQKEVPYLAKSDPSPF
jgi:hypothetical protein